MDFLLKDGVKYIEHNFSIETEFENIVFAHCTDIFGTNSILFKKKKIKTNAGIGTIPDGFVIDIEKEKWHIIEVELSTHPVYSHIVPQLTKFNTALKNPQTRKSLIRSFDAEIKADPFKSALLSSNGKDNETYRLLTDIVEKTPDLVIIIDKHNEELNDVSFPFKTAICTFKTYARENYGLGDNIYHFDPIVQPESIPTQITKTDSTRQLPKSKTPEKSKSIKSYNADDYIARLNNPNSQPSKIYAFIKTNEIVTKQELFNYLGDCGYKNPETNGSISACIIAFKTEGYIDQEGKANYTKYRIKE